MVTVIGYKNLVLIHDSANSQVYRARRTKNNQPVVLKLLAQEYPTTEQIRRYKQEYNLTCQLDSPAIIKAYSLEKWQNSYLMALEYFGGISLQQWLEGHQKLSLEEFLFLAIAITESLGEIHQLHIIHKDINPANIVFNAETKELKIIDFGISTQLSRENPTLKNPNVLEGTIAYISPEQTGRMNRSLDYRTDFYSLGVTFYEMLAGKLPFESSDFLELVHCHLAQNPPSLIGKIPQVLADIVIKLMAKNAEDRYQSAYGLKADLEECRRQLQKTGNITAFALGKKDISDRFSIPQKLYGRETEIASLLEAFERVAESGKVELMMVAGYSGIGKSSLVQELYKPITARRGYFISGKFDQFQRNIPYSAIVSAFRGLIRQLLGESEAELQIWREKLLKALGNNGQVIIDVIPEVELIIGKQPTVPVLGGNEAQNRFHLVFGNFIHVFCDKEHPLTLFIDDLQWADLATLQLMERMLLDGQTESLLLLGAYRNNEISPGHPLTMTMAKLEQNNASIRQIEVRPLPLNCIADLIGDTIQGAQEKVEDLASLVWQKTGGNPFFIKEFLQALYSENLLQFNKKLRVWQWNIEAIARRGFTDNVVELMVEKLQQLPPSAQEILSLAACLGADFDLTILSRIAEKSPQDTFELLKIALDRGFILPLSALNENLLVESYKFGHDRIQEASDRLLTDRLRVNTHAKIGQLLLSNTPESELNDKILEIVSHLNASLELLKTETEIKRLIHLNIQAAEKALNSTGYSTALDCIGMSIKLLERLGDDIWEIDRKLSLFLHEKAAEVACLSVDVSLMESSIQTVLEHSDSALETVSVYKTKIQAQTANRQPLQAIETALGVLGRLGVNISLHPQPSEIENIVDRTRKALAGKSTNDLLELPLNQTPEQLAIIEILGSVHSAVFFAAPQMIPIEICTRLLVCLKYGNSPESAHTYADYGLLLCGVFNDIETGYAFGKLALAITDRFPLSGIQARAKIVTLTAVAHWKEALKVLLDPLKQSYKEALSSGDLEFAANDAVMICAASFLAGHHLAELLPPIEAYCQAISHIHQEAQLRWSQVYKQTVAKLIQESDYPWILTSEVFDESNIIAQYQAENEGFGLFILYTNKAMLAYLFEELDIANGYFKIAKHYVANVTALLIQPSFFFYDSLVQLARSDSLTSKEQKEQTLQRIEANQDKLKSWGTHCVANYQHKYDLVEAEKSKFLGQILKAINLYDRAIAGAKANEYIQEEALANELAAKFYLDRGQEKVARVYMMDAHYCYSRWGAVAKVKHLEENYPQLFKSPTTTNSDSKIFNTRATSNSTGSADLDLATVIKSTNAISSEIVLENLLATLMDILVENAGAQRGILILPRGESLFIEATKEAELEKVSVLQSLPLDEFEKLSEKIVRYVARTRETIVLNNASTEGNFTDDTYIQQYHCQSIACTPLINQNQLQGIIYLENNLSVGAFTQERMALLRTLAAQGAISLENARLYNKIITVNKAYERFVPGEFLSFLEKKSIIDVKLGDQVEQEMTVLFSDIRNFTTISEQMTPAENFAFINEYLGYMEPQIQKHGGFIDKYIGDAIMALFPNSADDALKGAIAMLEELKTYNSDRQQRNLKPIGIGIGLHTGRLILGTVGGLRRMDGTVIGDAVNLSSRVEGLTKTYGVSLLITDKTWQSLNNPLAYDFRFVDKVRAKGKAKAVSLFEIFSADPPELRDVKIATKDKFEKAVLLYHQELFQEATVLFQECLEYCEGDRIVFSYLERCHHHNLD